MKGDKAERTGALEESVFAQVAAAAQAGEVMPTIETIRQRTGYASNAGVYAALKRIEAKGRIRLGRVGNRFVAEIPALGRSTALPHSRTRGDRWEPTIEQRILSRETMAAFGCGEVPVDSRSHRAPIVRARFAAAWLLKRRFSYLTTYQIARVLGRNDHSAGIYALKRAEAMRAQCGEFRRRTDALLAGAPMPPPQPFTPRSEPAADPPPARRMVRPRNDFGGYDSDGNKRARASERFLLALRREHPERFADGAA